MTHAAPIQPKCNVGVTVYDNICFTDPGTGCTRKGTMEVTMDEFCVVSSVVFKDDTGVIIPGAEQVGCPPEVLVSNLCEIDLDGVTVNVDEINISDMEKSGVLCIIDGDGDRVGLIVVETTVENGIPTDVITRINVNGTMVRPYVLAPGETVVSCDISAADLQTVVVPESPVVAGGTAIGGPASPAAVNATPLWASSADLHELHVDVVEASETSPVVIETPEGTFTVIVDRYEGRWQVQRTGDESLGAAAGAFQVTCTGQAYAYITYTRK